MPTEDQKIGWGEQADALIKNAFLEQCFNGLSNHYIEASINGVTVEHREDARKFVVLIDKLKQDLRSIATTGELAKKRAKDLTGESRTWSDMLNGR